ncbi:glucose PTS transporter subunit IIA [Mycoplasma sp. AC1221]
MKSIKLMFQRSTQKKKLNNSGSGKVRKVLSKISGAFMLPISVMSIAGLFLGIGAAIATGADEGSTANIIGNLVKQLGDPVFGALPLLFATAFVIAFTDEAGVGVFATIIAFLIFTAVQSVFIFDHTVKYMGKEWFNGALRDSVKTKITGYTIFFQGAGRNPQNLVKLVGTTLGIKSMQTSVFGGITIGLLVQWLYNRFHTIQLPQVISFFGGKRFVSIVAIPAAFIVAIIFLIFWPWIGVGLNVFGTALGKAPYGIESLVFGIIERSLIPFGLHHVFYAPLWYSSVGGDLNTSLVNWQQGLQKENITLIPGDTLTTLIKAITKDPDKYQGDSTAALSLVGMPNNIDYTLQQAGKPDLHISKQLFVFVADELGTKIGRFTDGKFGFMIIALPAAAAAMIMAAPKENRKVALGTVLPAGFTAMLTGVTEPIEFTFLFLAPYLFWGFHAFMAGLSFMFANLAGVHIPQAFSGGLLDFFIYGVINVAKGTHFWWTLVIGAAYAPVYYFVFYFVIKKFDLATPGRGGNTKLFTKADFQNKNAQVNDEAASEIDPTALAVVEAYGGLENITAFNNCASRLRYDVKDASKVDVDKLKAAGAFGVKIEGNNHAQAIMGPVSEQLNAKIKSQRELIAKYESEHKGQEFVTPTTSQSQPKIITSAKSLELHTAARGKILPLEDLKDGIFSEKMLGNGFVVKFDSTTEGNVYTPAAGTIDLVADTKHAYGITTDEGVKLLVHIGLDTVKLNGQGFKDLVKVGDKVKIGDKLASVDLEFIKSQNLRSDVIVVVLHEGSMSNFEVYNNSKADTTTEIVGIVRK